MGALRKNEVDLMGKWFALTLLLATLCGCTVQPSDIPTDGDTAASV